MLEGGKVKVFISSPPPPSPIDRGDKHNKHSSSTDIYRCLQISTGSQSCLASSHHLHDDIVPPCCYSDNGYKINNRPGHFQPWYSPTRDGSCPNSISYTSSRGSTTPPAPRHPPVLTIYPISPHVGWINSTPSHQLECDIPENSSINGPMRNGGQRLAASVNAMHAPHRRQLSGS